jgi:UDP-N-acetylmuramoyl-tripeptide--D-alanyl-D-alanine ligase
VGASPRASVRATDITLDGQGRASFVLVTDQGTAPVALRYTGEHQVGNALSVAAVALTVGMPLGEVASALGDARPLSRWRMEVHERADGVTIVNDAYNANPDSMRAALEALAAMGHGRRTWAVLGEMLELGPDSATEHEAVGRLAVRLGVSRVVAVGQGAQPLGDGACDEASHREACESGGEPIGVVDVVDVADTDAAYELLRQHLAPGDVVLVKSSRDAGLRWLGDRLAGDAGSQVPS